MEKMQIAPIIIGKLMNIGGMLQRNGNKMLLQYDLNHHQFSIFFEIAKVGKVKQKDMVNRLLLEKSHVSKIVKKLEKLGLITVIESDKDKRSSWLSVTNKGENILKEIREIFKNSNEKWSEAFDEKELMSMLDSLSKFQAVFKDKIDN